MNQSLIVTQTSTDAAAEASLGPEAYSLVPAATLTVDSEETYALAHRHRESIRTYRESVADVYDPQEADLKEILARTKERRAVHEKTAITRDAELKASMSAYQTTKDAKSRALNEQLATATRLAQQQVLNEHAAQLASEGKTGYAMEILATPLPDIRPPMPSTPLTTTLHHWVLLDASKLRPEYLQPDRTKITTAVRKHQHNAPNEVGPGSIKYAPVVNPRRESRNRS